MNVENQASNQMSFQAEQQLSAFIDGELTADELDQLLAALPDNADCCQALHTYQKIGSVIRQDHGLHTDGLTFLHALNAKICAEPAFSPVNQPQVGEVATPPVVPVVSVVRASNQEVANQSVFRWKLVAGLASVAVVAMVGWNSMNLLGLDSSSKVLNGQQIASSSATGLDKNDVQGLVQMPVTVGQNATVMLRDPRLDELLAARDQMGGAANLQMPASFLRNATFNAEKKVDCAEKAARLC